MNKIISIALVSLLLISTVGITVHKHYCDSFLVNTSILPHGQDDACDTDMPMSEDDCSDEHELYNVSSPLVLLVLNLELSPSIDWVKVNKVFYTNLYSEEFTSTKYFADLSPPLAEPNIYTKVQSFLL